MKSTDKVICAFMPNLKGGGAERVMVMLVNGFVERGYSVDLVVARADGNYKHLLNQKVRLIDCGSARVSRSFLDLVRYFRQNRPIVVLSTLYHASLVALIAKIASRIEARLFVRVENVLSKRIVENGIVRSHLLVFLARLLFPRADGIVAVSEGVAKDTIQFLGVEPSRVRTIYNPAYPDDIEILADEAVEEVCFNAGLPVILAVGSLKKAKDHHNLVRAFHIMSATIDARLVIIGEGEERKPLESLIRELGLTSSVHLLGFVANPFKYMKRAAVYVLSSKYEGLPGSLIQAMRCGCPIVSTDCEAGPAEILDKGRYGRLVPVADPEMLAQAVKETLTEKVDRQQLIARAKEFSTERAIEAYLSLFSLPLDAR